MSHIVIFCLVFFLLPLKSFGFQDVKLREGNFIIVPAVEKNTVLLVGGTSRVSYYSCRGSLSSVDLSSCWSLGPKTSYSFKDIEYKAISLGSGLQDQHFNLTGLGIGAFAAAIVVVVTGLIVGIATGGVSTAVLLWLLAGTGIGAGGVGAAGGSAVISIDKIILQDTMLRLQNIVESNEVSTVRINELLWRLYPKVKSTQ